jgi:hypothetical protein
MKKIFENLKNNKQFQEKLQEMKPKRNIWSVLVVIFLFFFPEYINVKYSKEINEWIVNLAQGHPLEKLADLMVWLSAKIFDGKISIINISLGLVILVWIFWDDIKSMLK